MTNNMNKLMDMEFCIASLYNACIECDQEGKKKDIFLNALNNAIKDEDLAVNNLNSQETQILQKEENIQKALRERKVTYTHIEENDMVERLTRRIVDKEFSKIYKQTNISLFFDVLLSEHKDIFLSFFDEEIANAGRKEKLIINKYRYIYSLPGNDEKRILERGFSTDSSLYLSSLMYSQIYNIGNDLYNVTMDKLSLDTLNEVANALESDTNGWLYTPKREVILSMFRTSIIQMSNQLYQEILQNLVARDDMTKMFLNDFFRGDLIEMTKKDRERHKMLSLKPKHE